MAQEPKPVDAEEVVPAKSSQKKIIIIVVAALLLIGAGAGTWFSMQHKSADGKKEEVKSEEPAAAPVFISLEDSPLIYSQIQMKSSCKWKFHCKWPMLNKQSC